MPARSLSGALALPFLLMVPGPLYAALIVTAVTGGKPGVVALLREVHHLAGGLGLVCRRPADGAGDLRDAGLSEHVSSARRTPRWH